MLFVTIKKPSLQQQRLKQFQYEWIFQPVSIKLNQTRIYFSLKVICTIFDIGALNDHHLFQTLNVLLFFHLSPK